MLAPSMPLPSPCGGFGFGGGVPTAPGPNGLPPGCCPFPGFVGGCCGCGSVPGGPGSWPTSPSDPNYCGGATFGPLGGAANFGGGGATFGGAADLRGAAGFGSLPMDACGSYGMCPSTSLHMPPGFGFGPAGTFPGHAAAGGGQPRMPDAATGSSGAAAADGGAWPSPETSLGAQSRAQSAAVDTLNAVGSRADSHTDESSGEEWPDIGPAGDADPDQVKQRI